MSGKKTYCHITANVEQRNKQFAAVSSSFERFRAVSCSSSPGGPPPPRTPPTSASGAHRRRLLGGSGGA
eukprot:2238615-Alexandrium_andersonii.AAC.1